MLHCITLLTLGTTAAAMPFAAAAAAISSCL